MSKRTSTNPWVVLVLICIAQFMVVLDATIVNVALPSIQKDLGLSEANLQWIINAYTLVFGGFLLLGGRAGDLLGRKRLFLIGLVIFTTASLLNGLSSSSGQLIGFRALQGLGAALVSPGRALDHLDDVRGGQGAREGARRVGRDRHRRLGVRPRARRLADAVVLVAVDLLRQRAGRRVRVLRGASSRAGVEGRARAQGLRPRRRSDGHRRTDDARLRDRQGRDRRLGLDHDDRSLRSRGGAARSHSSCSSCARRRRSFDCRSSAFGLC